MELKDGVDNQQSSIAVITHHIQIVQVPGAFIELFQFIKCIGIIALPRIEAEVLSVKYHATEATEVQLCLRLDTEAATHIVVTLNDVEVVTLRTTEQDTAYENTLFHLGERTRLVH